MIGPDNPYTLRLVLPLILTMLLLLLALRISNSARRYGLQIGILVCFLFVGLIIVMRPM
jgi:hypothetical protein